MARKPTAKRVTRREAVALLGAGVVLGTASVPAQSGSQPEPRGGKECEGLATVSEYNRSGPPPHKKIMFVDSCCRETRNALLVGVAHPNTQPTQGGKKHLKPVEDKLSTAMLAEYCYMVWGLSEAEVMMLRKEVPRQLKIEVGEPMK